MSEREITHSGFIAIVGKPNVGKSTLLNRLIGQKVAIVSQKPQTTRNRVMGVLSKDGAQMVFLDTPGWHKPRTRLGDYMMRQASGAVREVDLAVLVVEPDAKVAGVEVELLRHCGCPVLLAINKIDLVKKETLLAVIAAYDKAHPFEEIIPLSARTGEGAEMLYEALRKRLPEGPAYFPEDAFTDQTERQLLAEFVREKALRALDKEVPHGIAVEIEQFQQREDGLLEVGAVLYCERSSHKAIIIGKGGEVLKRISTAAREDMERLMGCKVFLRVFVKVKQGWRDSESFLRSVGFDDR